MTYTVYNKANRMERYTATGLKAIEVDNYYYEQELKKLSGNIKVKFYSGGGNTNHMNINTDSIEAIIDFLNTLKEVQK